MKCENNEYYGRGECNKDAAWVFKKAFGKPFLVCTECKSVVEKNQQEYSISMWESEPRKIEIVLAEIEATPPKTISIAGVEYTGNQNFVDLRRKGGGQPTLHVGAWNKILTGGF